MRVLVVDDHRNTRESLAVGFARLGFDITVAASAADGLSQLQDQAFAWAVCDVRMPGMDGVEFARLARTRYPDLGLILMTAYDLSGDERRLIEALAVRLVFKPVTATALAALCAATPEIALVDKNAC